MPNIVEKDNWLIWHCRASKYKTSVQTKATPLPGGLIIVHTTSIACTIVVTNLIVSILLL